MYSIKTKTLAVLMLTGQFEITKFENFSRRHGPLTTTLRKRYFSPPYLEYWASYILLLPPNHFVFDFSNAIERKNAVRTTGKSSTPLRATGLEWNMFICPSKDVDYGQLDGSRKKDQFMLHK